MKIYKPDYQELVFTLDPGETVESLRVHYEEDSKKVTALKLKTNSRSFIIGKKSDVNSKPCINLSKDEHFIVGFKTSYFIEKQIPYLTFISTIFEPNDGYQKYYDQDHPSALEFFIKRSFRKMTKVWSTTFKWCVFTASVALPILYLLLSIYNFHGGLVVLDKSRFNLDGPISIHTDSQGLAHIKADTKNDAFFGLGFAQAKERLWQIDIMRRVTQGRLSELLGEKALKSDKLMRSLGYRVQLENWEETMASNENFDMIGRMVNGINAFAENHVLPIEYFITGTSFEPWTKRDTLAITLLVSHGLTMDYQSEIWYQIIKERMGSNFVDQIMSYFSEGSRLADETILNDEELTSLGLSSSSKLEKELSAEKLAEKYARKAEEKQNSSKESPDSKLENESSTVDKNDKKEVATSSVETKEAPKDVKVEETKPKPEAEETKETLKEAKTEEIKPESKSQETKEAPKDVKVEESKPEPEAEKTKEEHKEAKTEEIKPEPEAEITKEAPKDVKVEETEVKENKNEETVTADKVEESQNKPKTNTNNKEEENKAEAISDTSNEDHSIPDKQSEISLENKGIDVGVTVENASNSWVISGEYTKSGKPILSNDPHLNNSMPTIHFLAKLYVGEWRLTGSFVAGTPITVSGSNNNVSWGNTSENTDISDICEEKIDGDKYEYDGKKYPLKTVTEEIRIKDSAPITIDVKWTKNGPIMEELLKSGSLMGLNFKHYTSTSFRLANRDEPFTSLIALQALYESENINDFTSKAHLLTACNLNVVLAEKETNRIGYVPVGTYPIRRSEYNGICEGWSSRHEIMRKRFNVSTPKLINPKKGFIVTANNKMASNKYKEVQKGFWYGARALRIRQMIEEKLSGKQITVEDNIAMQADVKDVFAEDLVPKLVKIAKKHLTEDDKYVELLSKWDFKMEKNKIEPLVWSIYELNLFKMILGQRFTEDEAKGLASLFTLYNYVTEIVNDMSEGRPVEAKECAALSGKMNCEFAVVKIFKDMEAFMVPYKNYKGGLIGWGTHKRKEYPHLPFGQVPGLSYIFSRTVESSGNRNTVNVARGPFNSEYGTFTSNHTANLRFICDMENPTEPFVSIDTGNSGHLFSRYYYNFGPTHHKNEMTQFKNFDFNHDDGFNTIHIKAN